MSPDPLPHEAWVLTDKASSTGESGDGSFL